MRNLVFIHILLMVGYSAASQPICGFDEVHQKKMRTDPAYRKAIQENELSVQRYISKNKSKISARTTGTNAILYTIPVVIHVMHTGSPIGTIYNPTDAQIQGAIDYLNQVYNGTYPGTQGIGDIQIQFVLAAKDPLCNATSGIDRIDASAISGYSSDGVSSDYGNTPGVDELSIKNLDRWNPFQYYNIWVVNKIDGKDGTSGSFVAGYAYLPNNSSSLYDGMLILATQMAAGQKTLPHEMGHAFGLYHTFAGSADKNSCPQNVNCNTDGDLVCDTDPETYNQLGGVVDFSCRTGTNVCTGTAYTINTESNYMNYTYCYNLFTAGQKARMLAFAATVYRRSLTTSLASSANYPLEGYAPPIAPSCTPTTSQTGLSANAAGILGIDINNRSIGSSMTGNDNGYVDGTTSCLNLIQLIRGNNYTFTGTLSGLNDEQMRAWIDFNNDGFFDNSTEQILFAPSIPGSSPAASSSFTIPSTARLNTVLRMRVIDDLTTAYGVPSITTGCTNPVYGQAEDYPVYISSNGVLPLTLNSFTGAIRNKTAVLSWITTAEQNLQSFDIEKSIDGRAFSKIAVINAANNSSSSNDYSYTDRNLSENNYYRLRINESNGADKLSQVVFLHDADSKQKLWLIKNPFTNYIELGCTKAGSQAKLQLLNSMGAIVAERTIVTQAGSIRWDMPASLSAGTYIVRGIAYGEIFAYKLIKQ
ncbi:MAG: zinc-dependent metalloprotease [Flavisolibacter sp.]